MLLGDLKLQSTLSGLEALLIVSGLVEGQAVVDVGSCVRGPQVAVSPREQGSGLPAWAARRLFLASSKSGAMAIAFWHAWMALSHCFNSLYAAQMLL